MSDSEEDPDLPSAEVCGQRCDEFAKITGTDTALAMFFLQDRNWDLERAVNAFYASSEGDQPATGQKKDTNDLMAKASSTSESKSKTFIDPEPHRIRLLSWNIDGLDPKYLEKRTKGVAKIISKEKPDVVFLQEVIKHSEHILKELCPSYHCIPANDSGYYTVMLLRTDTVKYTDHMVEPFSSTEMERNLLKVDALVKDIDVLLMTAHLESTGPFEAERKRQLQQCFSAMKEADPKKTVLFGGDLNLRDKELAAIGGIPQGIQDVWLATGGRPEAQYTWDMTRNDNLVIPGRFKPRKRFDRLYLRNSRPTAKLEPVYFELVGIERLKSVHRFPSDHWGMLTHYNKV